MVCLGTETPFTYPLQVILIRPRDPTSDRIFCTGNGGSEQLVPKIFAWHSGDPVEFHTQFDLLCYVLSILGRAPRGATRNNHHYPLLLLCARFFALAARDSKRAPYLASITFVDQESQHLPEKEVSGWQGRLKGRITAVTTVSGRIFKKEPELNLMLGSTFPLPPNLRYKVRVARGILLRNAGFTFPDGENHYSGSCAETHALLSLML